MAKKKETGRIEIVTDNTEAVNVTVNGDPVPLIAALASLIIDADEENSFHHMMLAATSIANAELDARSKKKKKAAKKKVATKKKAAKKKA